MHRLVTSTRRCSAWMTFAGGFVVQSPLALWLFFPWVAAKTWVMARNDSALAGARWLLGCEQKIPRRNCTKKSSRICHE